MHLSPSLFSPTFLWLAAPLSGVLNLLGKFQTLNPHFWYLRCLSLDLGKFFIWNFNVWIWGNLVLDLKIRATWPTEISMFVLGFAFAFCFRNIIGLHFLLLYFSIIWTQLFGKSLWKMKATKRRSKTFRILKIKNNLHIPILLGGVPMHKKTYKMVSINDLTFGL